VTDRATLAKINFLKKTKLFWGIPRFQLIHVLESLHERKYLKNEVLFSQGDIGRALFIVQTGSVKLLRSDPETGESRIVAKAGPGEFFGETALLEEAERGASAVADEDCRVFMLFKIKFDSLVFVRPQTGAVIAVQLAKLLSARLRARAGQN